MEFELSIGHHSGLPRCPNWSYRNRRRFSGRSHVDSANVKRGSGNHGLCDPVFDQLGVDVVDVCGRDVDVDIGNGDESDEWNDVRLPGRRGKYVG